eukprot:scaffold587_cov339-Pavlova_lutheri.AAC.38
MDPPFLCFAVQFFPLEHVHVRIPPLRDVHDVWQRRERTGWKGCQGHHGRKSQGRQEESGVPLRTRRTAVPRGTHPSHAQGETAKWRAGAKTKRKRRCRMERRRKGGGERGPRRADTQGILPRRPVPSSVDAWEPPQPSTAPPSWVGERACRDASCVVQN